MSMNPSFAFADPDIPHALLPQPQRTLSLAERNLLAQVVERAVLDASDRVTPDLLTRAEDGQAQARERLRLAEEALGWIFAADDAPQAEGRRGMTFDEVCMLLCPPVEAELVRGRIRQRLAGEGLSIED